MTRTTGQPVRSRIAAATAKRRTAVGRQPWLHDLVTVLEAPTVVLSGESGQIRDAGAEGALHSDLRVLSRAVVTLGGEEPAPIGHVLVSAQTARFSAVARNLGDDAPDPTVRVDRTRTVADGRVHERIEVSSTAAEPVSSWIEIQLDADLARVEQIKSGRGSQAEGFEAESVNDGVFARWSSSQARASVVAPGAELGESAFGGTVLVLRWPLDLSPRSHQVVEWTLAADTAKAPVVGVTRDQPQPVLAADDHRLAELARQSFSDLAALRMAPADAPEQIFYAAGSPWFFTLFGRDSIWAARLMLPFGTDLALGTLRALAERQGTVVDVASAQAPGKIPHELRSAEGVHDHMTLPALYYGTIDATPLWICLLRDAWRWGLPEDEVRSLLPALEAALGWLRDYADPDGDGFLEYLDESGTGLANQGWKDSGDSIRFSDGRIASGPVALCEVQAYAYEAAVGAADLLEHFGLDGAPQWREWAAGMQTRFRERFWVGEGRRRYPALALDGHKRPVDALTSNIGHLLGTGILSAQESEQIAELLTGEELSSGFGLRTMSTAEGGYSPLSYHCGSVWTHDTAIAVHGLVRSGLGESASGLVEGLLAASAGFGYRMPELYSGDARSGLDSDRPMPYPAACRPQAWAAAAIGPIVQALTGLQVRDGELVVERPASAPAGALTLSRVRLGADSFVVSAGRDGVRVEAMD